MDQSIGVNVRRVKILDYICRRSVPRGTGVNEITRNKTVSHVGIILGGKIEIKTVQVAYNNSCQVHRVVH